MAFFIKSAVLGSSVETDELSFTTMELVTSGTLTGAATSLDFTGLDLEAAGFYDIIISQKTGGAAGWDSLSMFYNGDTTTTNYYNQYIDVTHATITGARANAASVIGYYTGVPAFTSIRIAKIAGEPPTAMANVCSRPDSNIYFKQQTHTWVTTTNVTQITLTATEANGFDTGTKYWIFKTTA